MTTEKDSWTQLIKITKTAIKVLFHPVRLSYASH